MIAFLSWYVLITVLGWLTFPLAYFLFPALADRGYTLSRAFGLLLWGYIFWLFASFDLAQNDIGGLLLGLVILGGLSAWAFVNFRSQIMDCLREKLRLILTAEVLFLLAFGFMAFIRSTNPETATAGGEKWMEVAFINAILHSPTFPPHDPWLSGYAISYYYFGYVMAAMLAKFTSVPAAVAHNLMLALIFGLSAIGAYGLLSNLLANHRRSKEPEEPDSNAGKLHPWRALFAPLFLLIVSNLEGLFEVLHSRGIGWTFNPDGTATSSFWKWLDLQSLSQPPTLPLQWTPDFYIWWWRASRVIMDYDLTNKWMGDVIDEFPFFSYLLGDLHPHVLAMPFNLLAIAVALNVFLGGWRGKIDLFFGELQINKIGFFTSALVLGGLAFLNTWDILFAGALIVLSYALAQARAAGWTWERIGDMFLLGVPLVLAALILYLPFFVGFSSQASGILPNFMWPTRGADLWVAWGTLFVPLFAYLIYLWRAHMPANWRAGLGITSGVLILLLVAMFALGFLALKLQPQLVEGLLQAQQHPVGAFIADSLMRRLKYIGGLLTLLALLIPAFAFLFGSSRLSQDDTDRTEPASPSQASIFVLLLIALGVLLILVPDFVYLRDNFLYRINTVFKFYYQAWILLSLVAAFGVAVLLTEWRGLVSVLPKTGIVIVIVLGLVYPIFSLPKKTDNFKIEHPEQRTLDGAAYLANVMPDDYQAIQFMQRLDPGVVAEAVGGQYSEYARVATFTGMPAVLGWPGHEAQWRDAALQGSRAQDIQTLYTTNDWTTTQDIINRYHIRYIYVGNLERSTYRVNEEKFNQFLQPVFQQGKVTVYEVPQ